MFKYIFNYVVLIIIFLTIDAFLHFAQSMFNFFSIIPTITNVGKGTIFLIIPYTYLIVRFLFIRKANVKENTLEYLNIKNRIIIIVTLINIVSTLIEILLFGNTFIWIGYTFFISFFLIVLKTKKENENRIVNDNIRDYYDNKKM